MILVTHTFSSDGPTMGVIPPFCDPGPQTETDFFSRRGVGNVRPLWRIFGNLPCPPDRCRRMRAHLYACALCHALARPCSSAPPSRSRSPLHPDKERASQCLRRHYEESRRSLPVHQLRRCSSIPVSHAHT